MKYKKIISNYIKENSLDQQQSPVGNEGPVDVQKFLDLADQYLFKKYSKFAERINTPKKKAMLIAGIAKKFGIEASDLGKVKSILNTEGKINEVGYDSLETMGDHYPIILNRSAIVLDVLTKTQMDVFENIKTMSNNEKAVISGWIDVLINLSKGVVKEFMELRPEMEDENLSKETKNVTKVIMDYVTGLKMIKNNLKNYDISEIVKLFGQVTLDSHEHISNYIDVLRQSESRLKGRFN
jgi:hypothetical protein